MRNLNVLGNPIQQAYDGGDTFSPRALRNAIDLTSSNFQTIESAINQLEYNVGHLESRLGECYKFIDWVQEYYPATTQAYKAHNTVKHSFDKASGGEEFVAPGGGLA